MEQTHLRFRSLEVAISFCRNLSGAITVSVRMSMRRGDADLINHWLGESEAASGRRDARAEEGVARAEWPDRCARYSGMFMRFKRSVYRGSERNPSIGWAVLMYSITSDFSLNPFSSQAKV